MRYRTCPDITHDRVLWRNKNCALVLYYISMNRNAKDTFTTTLRQMEEELNITFSAVRNALHQLERCGYIRVQRQPSFTLITIDNEHLKEPAAFVQNPLLVLQQSSKYIEEWLQVPPGSTHILYEKFVRIQSLRDKRWTTSKELVNHFCNWYLRNALQADKMRQKAQQRVTPTEDRQKALKEAKDMRKDAITYEEYLRRKEAGEL